MRVHQTIVAIIATVLTQPAAAQTPTAENFMLRGTVGPYRVGATLLVDKSDHRTIAAGRYFYASKLADIPLRDAGSRDAVILQEPGGGTFRLHFIGNGSNGSAPLDFYTSVGLEGTWTGGGKTLPVKLGLEGISGGPPGHWYEDVTSQSDAAFEATARRFLHGATTGNVAEAASATHFPLRINVAHVAPVANAAQLKARWKTIFTPAYVAKLKLAIPHDMFVHEGEAMIGSGEVWFDDKGAAGLNPVLK